MKALTNLYGRDLSHTFYFLIYWLYLKITGSNVGNCSTCELNILIFGIGAVLQS